MTELRQRVALITGGSMGIGFATAMKLAERGFSIYIASRNQQTSARAMAAIHAKIPQAHVKAIPLDLSSLAAVRRCAEAFKATGSLLHVLINNGGGAIYSRKASLSVDGFELTLATNHLGHFLLTNLLLDQLKQSAPARVITVSSQTHDPTYGGGRRPDFDWDNLRGEKYYNPAVFYKNSKLANIWFAYELQRRLAGSGVTSNAVCPGFVPESIGDRKTGIERFFYKSILARMPFATSLDRAATSIAYAASDPSLEGVGGRFIVDCKEKRSSADSYNEALAGKLWQLSCEWCGLKGE